MIVACAPAASGPAASARAPADSALDAPLILPSGQARSLRALVDESPLTVLVFFSADCHCLERHEPRLRALFDAYHPRGVAVVLVDSEVGASAERDASLAGARGYPFPLVADPGARVADGLGAEYATYSVVLDRSGRVRYRGGIDTDKTHLHAGAVPYLANALDDALAGHDARVAEGKTLGCALRKW